MLVVVVFDGRPLELYAIEIGYLQDPTAHDAKEEDRLTKIYDQYASECVDVDQLEVLT